MKSKTVIRYTCEMCLKLFMHEGLWPNRDSEGWAVNVICPECREKEAHQKPQDRSYIGVDENLVNVIKPRS